MTERWFLGTIFKKNQIKKKKPKLKPPQKMQQKINPKPKHQNQLVPKKPQVSYGEENLADSINSISGSRRDCVLLERH